MAKRKAQATIELKKTRGHLDLEVKRFYVPGYVLKSTCPECGAPYECDYSENYFSYPPVGKPFTETLTCYADVEGSEAPCEHEWDVSLQLDLTLSVA